MGRRWGKIGVIRDFQARHAGDTPGIVPDHADLGGRAGRLLPRSIRSSALLLDLAIGAGLTVYLIAATSLSGIEYGWEFGRDLIEGVAVAIRRVWTIPALAAVMVVTAFNDLTTWPYPLGLAIMLYTVAAEDFPRWFCWAAAALGALILLLPWPSNQGVSWTVMIYLVPEMLLFTVAPVLVGLYSKARQTLMIALSQRAVDADRRRRLEAERVRADERNRLANEIHDVVAHRVSLMVVHTGALKLAATDDQTRETADLVRSSGRLALEELRELVGVLRSDESAPLAPTATLANLPTLIGESRAVGTKVDFLSTGTTRKLATTVERTGYRVVQESLTNARKHAPGAAVVVEVGWEASTLDIRVANGPPDGPVSGFPESGHGLASLGERVGLVAGTFEAGPTEDGGWAVHASLPYGGDA